MDVIKKILGVVWIVLGPAAIIFLAAQAYEKINLAAEGAERTNTALQWGIILFIFLPICTGLVIFGYYALRGEYNRLPADSASGKN
ncbi:DUF6814 family protein [Pedobacter sp. SYP-B3415]|uniref:DUF6814 family protein n=1 Tax=Pedobacter sp. SYP-B3415 TaxID=2496641 RepID=UPI00101CE484|nr:hypothetical protein [Pedobacter sp. SYP-B3415]